MKKILITFLACTLLSQFNYPMEKASKTTEDLSATGKWLVEYGWCNYSSEQQNELTFLESEVKFIENLAEKIDKISSSERLKNDYCFLNQLSSYDIGQLGFIMEIAYGLRRYQRITT